MYRPLIGTPVEDATDAVRYDLARCAPGDAGARTTGARASSSAAQSPRKDGRIVFAGPDVGTASRWDAAGSVTLDGRWITPGLIDCHTHLVYAGDRAHEFELRLAGASYEEIARAGGGILSTVKVTRAASEDDLVAAAPAAPRPPASPKA